MLLPIGRLHAHITVLKLCGGRGAVRLQLLHQLLKLVEKAETGHFVLGAFASDEQDLHRKQEFPFH